MENLLRDNQEPQTPDYLNRSAYFAGIIDGEGCIGYYPRRFRKNKTLQVEVEMTHEETVRSIHEHFGVGNFRAVKLRRNKRTGGYNKQSWKWQVVCNDAKIVIEQIKPWLITKAETVRLIELEVEENKNES